VKKKNRENEKRFYNKNAQKEQNQDLGDFENGENEKILSEGQKPKHLVLLA
jgi:hypothetical protein